jgi:hypothetical protein
MATRYNGRPDVDIQPLAAAIRYPIGRLSSRLAAVMRRLLEDTNLGILTKGKNAASSGPRLQGSGCMFVLTLLGATLVAVAASLAVL